MTEGSARASSSSFPAHTFMSDDLRCTMTSIPEVFSSHLLSGCKCSSQLCTSYTWQIAELAISDTMAPTDGSNLRFAVGDRVSCNMGSDGWASGKVLALHYREASWIQLSLIVFFFPLLVLVLRGPLAGQENGSLSGALFLLCDSNCPHPKSYNL